MEIEPCSRNCEFAYSAVEFGEQNLIVNVIVAI